MKVIDLKNNCSLPFTGMQIDTDGRISPCCLYKNNLDPDGKIYKINQYQEYWDKEAPRIQKNFRFNNYSKGCSTCFDQDNITSGLRLNATEMYLQQNITFKKTATPQWLDIRFGNYCNLKCIMCHGDLSSQIFAEQTKYKNKFKQIGIYPVNFEPYIWWEDPDIFAQILQLVQKAKYISFSGGEPLLTQQLHEIIDNVSPNCIIDINTNLTKLNDKHISQFKKIKNVKIHVSLDGIGAHHEYIRFGSDWATIDNNIKKLLDLKNIDIIFTYLLQHTSVYTFPQFFEYFSKLNKEIVISSVYSNSVDSDQPMTINSVLPEEVEQFKFWHQTTAHSYKDIINEWLNTYQFNQQAHDKFKNYVLLLDEIRGCNFRATFNPLW